MRLLSSTNIVRTVVTAVAICAMAAVWSCRGGGGGGDEQERLLRSVDSAAARQSEFLAAREQELKALKQQYMFADADGRTDLARRLSHEYYSYNLDTAAHYARVWEEGERRRGHRSERALASLYGARILLVQGQRTEAMNIADSALADTAYLPVRLAYYDFMGDATERAGQNPTQWYRLLAEQSDSLTSDGIYWRSAYLRWRGRYPEAIDMLKDNRKTVSADKHGEAITEYLIGSMYLLQNDTAAAISHIARSACRDLQTPVRDYRSLFNLANLLLSRGEAERAYRYISLAVEDANASGAYNNILAVNNIMPQILRAHEQVTQTDRRNHIALMWSIFALLVVLAIALWIALRSRNIEARMAVREKELNRSLRDINSELKTLNDKLRDSNRVKDAYLVQYFDLCSYFLDSYEKFRNGVSTAVRTKGAQGVEKYLAHADDSRELREFYSNFDSTFLNLFPDFVSGFNALIAPEAQVSLNPDGSMPNELRTFALIRLGITDSARLAAFLRRSLSTIYNYRVKMRNASLGPRNTFEDRVAAL